MIKLQAKFVDVSDSSFKHVEMLLHARYRHFQIVINFPFN